MAPAMHSEMWTHPATAANVRAAARPRGHRAGPGGRTADRCRLRRRPATRARTHRGDGRLLLLHQSDALPRDLAGRRVLVTAGGTREPLDPVRYLGNRSSGKQGYAIALMAAARGAEVTLVAANAALAGPPGVTVVPVTDARELEQAVIDLAPDADAVVMAAAVADFRPKAFAARRRSRRTPGAAPSALDPGDRIRTSSPACRRAGPDGQRDRRVRRGDRRRARFSAGPRAGQAGPQGLRPAGGQRRRCAAGVRGRRQLRPSSWPPTEPIRSRCRWGRRRSWPL